MIQLDPDGKFFEIQRTLLYSLSLKPILVNDILLSGSPFRNQVTLHIYIPRVKQLLVSLLANAELFSILCIHAFSSASFQVIYGIGFLPTYTKRKVIFYSSFFHRLLPALMKTLLFVLFMQELASFLQFLF